MSGENMQNTVEQRESSKKYIIRVDGEKMDIIDPETGEIVQNLSCINGFVRGKHTNDPYITTTSYMNQNFSWTRNQLNNGESQVTIFSESSFSIFIHGKNETAYYEECLDEYTVSVKLNQTSEQIIITLG